jgi:hypothetical protein
MALIITSDSHVDHGLSPAHLAWLTEELAECAGFTIRTLTLPKRLKSVPCGLYGPTMGDAPVPDKSVEMVVRGGRAGLSRMVKRPQRPVRTVSIIAGPHDGEPCVLYTAFGGPVAPREPWDPSLKTAAEKAESEDFWSKHALSSES